MTTQPPVRGALVFINETGQTLCAECHGGEVIGLELGVLVTRKGIPASAYWLWWRDFG